MSELDLSAPAARCMMQDHHLVHRRTEEHPRTWYFAAHQLHAALRRPAQRRTSQRRGLLESCFCMDMVQSSTSRSPARTKALLSGGDTVGAPARPKGLSCETEESSEPSGKSRDCSPQNSTNPDRDQLATVLKSCTTLSSDRPAQEDTAVPRLAPSSGSHQSSASTAASRGPKTRRRSQPARAPCPEPSAAATSAALWPSFSFLGPHHPPYARAPRGDQQQSLQGSASFTPMLVQTERHPAGLAAPRPGHGSRQKRHEDTAKWRLPQIGAVSTHARMQTARDCTLAPHTHQVS
jgi:hypothetical protein